MNTKNTTGLKVKTTVKSGGLSTMNHNRAGLKVKTTVRSGGLSTMNHNRSLRSF
jgi:hypothetical protein